MLNSLFIRILNIGTLIKDCFVNKMYFHLIFASAIISYVFVGLCKFIITTAVAFLFKIGHSVPVCCITGQACPLPSQ